MVRDIINSNGKIIPGVKELEILREYFPACFHTDGSFDIERLREYLNDKVSISDEGYELRFLGKNYARMLASLDTTTVIVPDETHNTLPKNRESGNIYISGDNIDALKHLVKSYSGKIKCIYIDPPYNTGKDRFVYNDKFSFTPEELSMRLDISIEKAQRILDLARRGSSSHSAWLMFMLPRLLLARDLLTKDGVILISIDDNEQANLKLLCDDIFGEENLLGELILKTATDNNPTQINTEHEYMLIYARNHAFQNNWERISAAAERIRIQYRHLKDQGKNLAQIQTELRKWIKSHKQDLPQVSHYNNVDEKGVYSSSSNSSNPHPGGYDFDIFHPITKKACPKPANGWRWPESTFLKYAKSGEVEWGDDESTQPHIKKRLETASEYLRSIIYEDNRASTKSLSDLFDGKKVFDNPKPHDVIVRLLDYATDKDSMILDFFSGSGTTAHAVMSLNSKDSGTRKFIAVQLPEDLDDLLATSKGESKTIAKNAIEVLQNNHYPHTLDFIGIERIKRAARNIKEEDPSFHGDVGFRHFTLKEPSALALEKMISFDPASAVAENTILDEFGVPTVLATWLERDGYGLTADYETLSLDGYEAYYIDKHLYLINSDLSDKAITSLLDRYQNDPEFNPQNIVIFGYALAYTELQSLKDTLATVGAGEKNLSINFDMRY